LCRTGQGWNVGTRYRKIKKSAPLSEILIENSNYINTNNLKKRLLKENILEYKCNICNITEWINKPLTLHLDHKNGNNMDNRIENLRLLCPNCHSQTETYCNKTKNSKCNDYRKKMYIKYKDSTIEKILQKKQKTKKENFCICGKKIKESSNYCKKCYNLKQRKVERPTYEQLLKDIKELNYTNTGKKYDVSDNTIRKWLKSYNG